MARLRVVSRSRQTWRRGGLVAVPGGCRTACPARPKRWVHPEGRRVPPARPAPSSEHSRWSGCGREPAAWPAERWEAGPRTAIRGRFQGTGRHQRPMGRSTAINNLSQRRPGASVIAVTGVAIFRPGPLGESRINRFPHKHVAVSRSATKGFGDAARREQRESRSMAGTDRSRLQRHPPGAGGDWAGSTAKVADMATSALCGVGENCFAQPPVREVQGRQALPSTAPNGREGHRDHTCSGRIGKHKEHPVLRRPVLARPRRLGRGDQLRRHLRPDQRLAQLTRAKRRRPIGRGRGSAGPTAGRTAPGRSLPTPHI